MTTQIKMTMAEVIVLRIQQLKDSITYDERCLEAARSLPYPDEIKAHWIQFFAQRVQLSQQVLGHYQWVSGKAMPYEQN